MAKTIGQVSIIIDRGAANTAYTRRNLPGRQSDTAARLST